MCAFWSSVALMSGRYHGQPMVAHLPLPIDTPHFDRWLEIFAATARDVCPPPAAAHFLERAHRIADSLELGIAARKGEIRPKRARPASDHAAEAGGERRSVRRHAADRPDKRMIRSVDRSRKGSRAQRTVSSSRRSLSPATRSSPDAFWREMKRGIVYGVVERGEGEDAGRTRLTFRYRARSWSVTLEDE